MKTLIEIIIMWGIVPAFDSQLELITLKNVAEVKGNIFNTKRKCSDEEFNNSVMAFLKCLSSILMVII